jgi:hypothetical protein
MALPNDEALGDLTDVDVPAADGDAGGAADEEEAPALAEPELELED